MPFQTSTLTLLPNRTEFDFINVHEFHATNFTTRLQYFWLYLLFAKSVAVYIADIYTAIALLASNRWSAQILQVAASEQTGSKTSAVLEVPFNVGKWVFTGCIIFSFLLLLWEARKSRAIIRSRDISYAFTNVMSQNWYCLRSYDHFCFFCQIDNSKKKKDEAVFFVFFTFKGWKRLLLADAPRQVINAITLYSFGKSANWTTDLSVYFGGSVLKAGVIITMLFTLVIWAGSALLLILAAIMYVPLLCYIQGNLKEYVCHKVDKRIAELMKRKNRKRLAKEAEIARKEARGDYSHLKDKKTGKLMGAPRPQPTLPKVGLGDHDLLYSDASDAGSIRAGSIRGGTASSRYHYPPPQPSSALARTAYPFNQSEPESLHRVAAGYAESISSADGFAARGAPMPYDSSVSLIGGGGEGMRRAPSYKSDWDDGGYYAGGTEKEIAGYYTASDDHPSGPSQLGHSDSYSHGLYRSQSTAPPPAPASENYHPPSRQQLYERTAPRQPSQSDDYHLPASDSVPYGGWEESGSRYYAQPQDPYYPSAPAADGRRDDLRRAETGNFAGRGAGGRR